MRQPYLSTPADTTEYWDSPFTQRRAGRDGISACRQLAAPVRSAPAIAGADQQDGVHGPRGGERPATGLGASQAASLARSTGRRLRPARIDEIVDASSDDPSCSACLPRLHQMLGRRASVFLRGFALDSAWARWSARRLGKLPHSVATACYRSRTCSTAWAGSPRLNWTGARCGCSRRGCVRRRKQRS